jgi:hypothetical protein
MVLSIASLVSRDPEKSICQSIIFVNNRLLLLGAPRLPIISLEQLSQVVRDASNLFSCFVFFKDVFKKCLLVSFQVLFNATVEFNVLTFTFVAVLLCCHTRIWSLLGSKFRANGTFFQV